MAQRGLLVEAIDIVDRHIRLAKQNIRERNLASKVNISDMNYGQLAFSNDSFEGIYTIETLVHADDPAKVMAEFYRALKPGGKLVLFEYSRAKDSDISKTARKAFNDVNTYATMPTFQLFTYGVPKKMLTQAGFKDITVEDYSPHILPMLRWFAASAYVPYQIIKLFGLQSRFVNAMSAVEYYKHRDCLRYVAVTATKPM